MTLYLMRRPLEMFPCEGWPGTAYKECRVPFYEAIPLLKVVFGDFLEYGIVLFKGKSAPSI